MRHPRFHFRFLLTSSFWLDFIERFFAVLRRKRIRRGTFTSVAEVHEAIRGFIGEHNAD